LQAVKQIIEEHFNNQPSDVVDLIPRMIEKKREFGAKKAGAGDIK
jgi:hypothetical protein